MEERDLRRWKDKAGFYHRCEHGTREGYVKLDRRKTPAITMVCLHRYYLIIKNEMGLEPSGGKSLSFVSIEGGR